ncbi:MAG: peptidoglycan bridge formation glycyltransferase FemA/FemB family protein [Lachnospiraceae bacterium]|nr:peptidoglycan bridge formation glycyltransferase FemA/FemB family protein [Lachnospiraceae bacterium]
MERIKKVAFVRIHDIWFDTARFLEEKEKISALHTNDVLEKKMYDFQQVTKTFVLDISGEEKEIFSKFEYKSARYAINRAIRDGVTVHRIVSQDDWDQYMDFQRNFCKEKGIPVLEKEEIKNLTGYYAISAEGEYLGACAFIESADQKTVRYKYGATLHKLNANEIILWEAIRDYHNRGYRYFDFGGCIPTEDKESYYYRHYHFKKKFGGELVDSYTYFRIKGCYHIFYYLFIGVVNTFFKGDVNGFTNWLNQKKILH